MDEVILDHLPARLLRRVRDRGGAARRRDPPRPRRPRASGQPRPAVREVRDRLQRRAASTRRRGCCTPLRRSGPKGGRQLRAGLVGAGARARSPSGCAPLPGEHRPQRPLHRHLRAARLPLPACASSTASARPRSTPTRSATRPGTSRSTTCSAPRSTASTRAPRATRAAILVWGANPSASAPHQHEHWLAGGAGDGDRRRPGAHADRRAADLHLRPFPGSDAALAFALAHVIRRDGLLDRELLAAHAVGFEELEPLLERCTPALGRARSPACRPR